MKRKILAVLPFLGALAASAHPGHGLEEETVAHMAIGQDHWFPVLGLTAELLAGWLLVRRSPSMRHLLGMKRRHGAN